MQKGMARTMGTFYSGNSQTTADSSATLATFATISSKTQPNPATQLEKSTSFIKEKASSSSAFIPAEFKPPRQANTEIAGLLASQVLSLQDYKITGLNNVDSIFDDSDSDSEEGDGAGVNEDKTSLEIESTAFLEDPKANNDKNLGLKPHPHDSNKKNLGTLKKGVKRAEDKFNISNHINIPEGMEQIIYSSDDEEDGINGIEETEDFRQNEKKAKDATAVSAVAVVPKLRFNFKHSNPSPRQRLYKLQQQSGTHSTAKNNDDTLQIQNTTTLTSRSEPPLSSSSQLLRIQTLANKHQIELNIAIVDQQQSMSERGYSTMMGAREGAETPESDPPPDGDKLLHSIVQMNSPCITDVIDFSTTREEVDAIPIVQASLTTPFSPIKKPAKKKNPPKKKPFTNYEKFEKLAKMHKGKDWYVFNDGSPYVDKSEEERVRDRGEPDKIMDPLNRFNLYSGRASEWKLPNKHGVVADGPYRGHYQEAALVEGRDKKQAIGENNKKHNWKSIGDREKPFYARRVARGFHGKHNDGKLGYGNRNSPITIL